jgi:hypothetical protein
MSVDVNDAENFFDEEDFGEFMEEAVQEGPRTPVLTGPKPGDIR